MRVGLIGIADNIPVYLAAKLGYFKEEGLTVTTTVFPGGAATQPALFAGKIDILHIKSNPHSIQVWEDLMLKSGLLKQRVGAAKLLYRTALE